MILAGIAILSILVLYGYICYRIGYNQAMKTVIEVIQEVRKGGFE
jgi:hypothetical protein